MTQKNTKSYYRAEEVAFYFSVSPRTIRRLLEEEKLQATRIRGCLRISIEEIRRYEESILTADTLESKV
ncbi:MAG: helix-turn-helix domain-containing protein [Deltaproteobacteria bacterium]|nr:helix-turn-helix domain-containing protein [Deltaproteobacteria bacterium]